MKHILYKLSLLVLLALSSQILISCIHGKYDDSEIRQQIAANTQAIQNNQTTITKLNTLISNGALITKVVPFTDGTGGLDIFVSNQVEPIKLYNGSKGETGAAGAVGPDAVVWTVGTDGYWYKNGEKTSYPSQGSKGTNGTNGTNGKDGTAEKGDQGAAGSDGNYYVPNADGTWDVYNKLAQLVQHTSISWKAKCLSAVISNGLLTISGLTGDTSSISIPIAKLQGIAINREVHKDELKGFTSIYFSKEVDPTNHTIKNGDYTTISYLNNEINHNIEFNIIPLDAYIPDNYEVSIKSKTTGTELQYTESSHTIVTVNGEKKLRLVLKLNDLPYNESNYFAVQLKADGITVTSDYLQALPINGVIANFTPKESPNIGEKFDVEWVQLWSGGPKFARNRNVTSGNKYEWKWGQVSVTDSYYSGSDYDVNGNLKKQWDTATAFWGDQWRMPTKAECDKLVKYYKSSFNYSGEGSFSNNKLNLPAHIWTSTPSSTDLAWDLWDSSGWPTTKEYLKSSGTATNVRAVLRD